MTMWRRKLQKTLTQLLLLKLTSVSTVGLATDTTPSLDEMDFLADIPVVISASRLRQPVTQIPASITIIDRQTIEAMGNVEIYDLLRLVPGFQVANYTSGFPVVTYHGFSDAYSGHIQLLVDGRSAQMALNSNIDWEFINVSIDNIERIEVVRGSNAPAYGSTAFTAAVNIITKPPQADTGGYLKYGAGSNQRREVLTRYANATANLEYRITGTTEKDNGFDDTPDSKRHRAADLNGILHVNATNAIEANAGLSNGRQGVQATGSVFDPFRDREVTNHYGQVKWKQTQSADSELSVQLYTNRYQLQDEYDLGPLTRILEISEEQLMALFGQPDQTIRIGKYDGVFHRSDVEAVYNTRWNPRDGLMLGVGSRIDSFTSKFLLNMDGPVSAKTSRIFTSLTHSNDVLVMNYGATLEQNSIVGSYLSPRITANILLNDRQSIRLNSTQASRPPSLLEEYVHRESQFNDGSQIEVLWASHGNLKPEQLHSFEIGYHLDSSAGLNVDAKLFQEKITDLISFQFDPDYPETFGAQVGGVGALVYNNSGQMRMQGVEFELVQQISRSDRVGLSYSYVDSEGSTQNVVANSKIPAETRSLNNTTPKYTLSTFATVSPNDRTTLTLLSYIVDGFKWRGDGDEVERHSRFDLVLSQQRRWAPFDVQWVVNIKNLTDNNYVDFRKENIAERQLLLTLQFSH